MTDVNFKELKERLAEEGLVVKKVDYDKYVRGQLKLKEMHFLDRAYAHFRARQEILHKLSLSRSWDDWTKRNTCMISYGWESIRKLVLWSYGVCIIRYLPDDKKDEINDYAITIIDTIFDQYSKMWDEEL